jgi:hypothetical protein
MDILSTCTVCNRDFIKKITYKTCLNCRENEYTKKNIKIIIINILNFLIRCKSKINYIKIIY